MGRPDGMVEHSEWPDDNLIADLIFRMRSEYTELLTHELEDRELALLSHPGNPMDVDTRLSPFHPAVVS
ncbi:hypothetical protein [Actinokineospora xionganensis]|uniref:Uncharacterized protein n=1 Tax=Actinokineospora xionganensis TaxID=2684470 RepID=A0ABR7LF95_9PSEU|nr:hypothetical protein [Actinokineospora xionganensis]MBC6451163.1 hypothetical protein [Actinokineospora xionganensis]